ncbi:hypothetical protein BJH93_05285 [Kocuria polaris]|nr:hypothetical protein [Kocuria polaris]
MSYPQQPPVVIRTEPRGASITSLVLGLCSVALGFTFVVPLVGVIMGIIGLMKEPASKSVATWGIILNAVMMLGWLLLILFLVPLLAVAVFGLS